MITHGNTQVANNDFSTTIGKEWFDGNKNAVKLIAEGRLRQNSEDLASQLILFEYAMQFMDTDTLKTLIPRIRKTSAAIKTPHFTEQKELLSVALDEIESLLPSVTIEMRNAEAYKGNIKHKPIGSLPIIKALESDALVPALNEAEKVQLLGSSKTIKQ
jgi:hypothetical protein